MWLTTTQGFYSAVAHRDRPGWILVRCRVKADLERLGDQIPGLGKRIFRDLRADYPYRVEVTTAEWARAVSLLALDVDYPNFKNAVKEEQGSRRAWVYHGVWAKLLALESPALAKYRWPSYYGDEPLPRPKKKWRAKGKKK